MTEFTVDLVSVRARVAAAARSCGRDPDEITLIGVSKGQPVGAIAAALDQGLADFGENYLQEALAKIAALQDRDATWHFIGPLQTNKTRPVAEHFGWLHTLARLKVARRLSAARDPATPLQVCLQLSLDADPQRGGAGLPELLELGHAVRELPGLKLRGLMCVPPPDADPGRNFGRVAAAFAELRAAGFDLDTLSLGMSADLEAAVAAGSTHVRIGTALFGARPPRV